jgi:ElaB/YqjD/DUF883 family membrane-anchored ribosome-binding protein
MGSGSGMGSSGTGISGASGGMGSRHEDNLSDQYGSGSSRSRGDDSGSSYERRNRSHDMGSQMKDQTAHAREVADEWTQKLRSTVREHPLVAIAAAVTLGSLLGRRRR